MHGHAGPKHKMYVWRLPVFETQPIHAHKQHEHVRVCHGPGAEPYGSEVEPHGPEVEPYGLEVEPYGSEEEPHGLEAEPYGSEAEPHGPEVEPYGSEAKPHGPEVEPYGPEVEPHGPEVEPYGSEAEPQGLEAEQYASEAGPHGPEAEPYGPEVEPHGPEAEPHGLEAEPYGPEAEPHGPEAEPVATSCTLQAPLEARPNQGPVFEALPLLNLPHMCMAAPLPIAVCSSLLLAFRLSMQCAWAGVSVPASNPEALSSNTPAGHPHTRPAALRQHGHEPLCNNNSLILRQHPTDCAAQDQCRVLLPQLPSSAGLQAPWIACSAEVRAEGTEDLKFEKVKKLKDGRRQGACMSAVCA